MGNFNKLAYLFPGQGAQYAGMGKDFYDRYPEVRAVFQEAEEIIGRNLSKVIFQGPDQALAESKNSQPGIFILSVAILEVLKKEFPNIRPAMTAGLSLGEYTALYAAEKLAFNTAIGLVKYRSENLEDSYKDIPGAMAVILGMNGDDVEKMIQDLKMPNDLWTANFNCPGQVVISGTVKGVQAGAYAAQKHGAKKVIPLPVHSPFHTPLMKALQVQMEEPLLNLKLSESPIRVVMNIPGNFVDDLDEIRNYLLNQLSNPVRWEQGIQAMENSGADLYLEIGCGTTLHGFNRKIGVAAPTINIEKVSDLEILSKELG